MVRVSPGRWIPGIVAIATMLTMGCNDDTVTGPEVRATPTLIPTLTPTLTPTPRQPGVLNGWWSGTVKDAGATDEFFCPPKEKAVRVNVHHSGDLVGFILSLAGCSHDAPAEFVGFSTGQSLGGFLDARGTASCMTGSLSGTATANHILLNGRASGPCNSVVIHVDLTR